MPAANFRLGNDFFSRNAYHIVINKYKVWLSCICKKMYVCVCSYRFLIFNPTSICNREEFNPNGYYTCNDLIRHIENMASQCVKGGIFSWIYDFIRRNVYVSYHTSWHNVAIVFGHYGIDYRFLYIQLWMII